MADILSYVLCLLLGAHLVICCNQIRTNKSELCDTHRQYNTSCYMQLPNNFNPEDCTLIFEKNTPRCLSEKIPVEEMKQSSQTVQLKAYQYKDSFYVLPSFNVTMTNIKWNAINLKFTIGNESVCIDIYITKSKQLPPEWSIFYDCLWYSELIEGKYVLLEYLAIGNDNKEARRFSFVTPATIKLDPCNKSAKSRETLTYLDLTFRPDLTLHIQKLPAHLQVHEYEVKKCFCTECSLHQSFEDCVHIETIEAGSESDEELTVPLNIAEESGNFFFIVYANSNVCENGTCYISRTETLTNKDLKGMVIWLSIGLVLLLLLLIVGSLLWKKYIAKLLAAEVHNMRRRTVLLLHHPLHSVHTHVVTYLAQFLEQHCKVDVLLDIRDIPQTEHKDPVFWYSSEISSVSFVAVISSPPCSDGQDATYKDLHILGLNFVKELLFSKTSKTEIFTIMLPYCNEFGIPVLARHFRCIRLMQDIDSMISLIHGNTHSLFGRSFCIRQALLREIHNSLKSDGNNLKNSIAEMENIIKHNGKSRCVLKGPVYEKSKSSMETQEKSLSLRKSVFEIRRNEELNDENDTEICHVINDDEFRISRLNLTGPNNSAEMVPRKPHCSVQTSEFSCDHLQL